MSGGYGKVLRVNLSEGKVSQEEIPEDPFNKFLTGAGQLISFSLSPPQFQSRQWICDLCHIHEPLQQPTMRLSGSR